MQRTNRTFNAAHGRVEWELVGLARAGQKARGVAGRAAVVCNDLGGRLDPLRSLVQTQALACLAGKLFNRGRQRAEAHDALDCASSKAFDHVGRCLLYTSRCV